MQLDALKHQGQRCDLGQRGVDHRDQDKGNSQQGVEYKRRTKQDRLIDIEAAGQETQPSQAFQPGGLGEESHEDDCAQGTAGARQRDKLHKAMGHGKPAHFKDMTVSGR